MNNNSKVKFVNISKADYDSLSSKDNSTVYFVMDNSGNKIIVDNKEYSLNETAINTKLSTKQDTLVSGTNIKTINNTTLLGSGNIEVVTGEYDTTNTKVELEQGTGAISFIQTTDGLSVIAATGATPTDFIDRELVSKSYVSRFQTQAQVEALIADELSRFDKLDYQIVTTLPATGSAGVRYLIKHPTDDRYEEWIYVNNQWYDIGATDEVNLSDYYTKQEADLLLADKADTADLPTLTSELTNDGDGTHNFVTFGNAATDSTYGVVKLNSAQSIGVNAQGQLEVGGRMGQFPTTTGLFAPNDRAPRDVNDYSLLITDAIGIEMAANRALAIVSGVGITVQSASAGTTVYYANNTYVNRILAKTCENGYISRDEATSKVEQIIKVVSVTINGSTFHPDSAPDSSTPIRIELEKTANPSTTITQLRMFGLMKSYASAHIGNGVHSDGSGGRSLMIGGGITKTGGNDVCMVGQQMYNTGNGNAMFGRNHIARKNRGFFAGTGHDSTNARSESAAAVGEWSYMDSSTMFAVGNGTSATARSNAFEVTADGGVILKSPNGTRYKITVDNAGTISATAI